MPASPSSSAQEARQRLGEQLRQLRTGAGLTGVEFARRAGWTQSATVSIVEKGRRTITSDHIRTWCRICDAAPERETDLLVQQANVARMWIALREHSNLGLDARQKATIGDLYEKISSELDYQTKVISGLLQTRAYMTEVLRGVRRDRQLSLDDVEQAVTTRMNRHAVLHRPGVKLVFLMEEAVLWYRPYAPQIHREQLDHVLDVMGLASVVVAVIPQKTDRRGIRPRESFSIIEIPGEATTAQVELLSGLLNLTDPYDVDLYRRSWADLWSIAVVGEAARNLIRTARDDLT